MTEAEARAPRRLSRRRFPMLLAGIALPPALLQGCAPTGPLSCGIRPQAEIPLRVVDNIPLVDVRLNGAPATMVLDTGAERTVLTEAAARRVGLQFDPRNIQRGAGAGGVVTSFAARVRRMELAGLSIPDHPVLATPHSLGSVGGTPVDGLLPALVLSAFDVDLDLPGRKITLYAGTVCGDTIIPPWSEPFISLPADFSRPPRVNLRVRAGDQELRALLDTGAQAITITARAAATAGVGPAELEAGQPVMVRGVGPQPVQARRVRLPELQIGPETRRNTPVIVTDSGMDRIDMILGMDYLAPRRLWLSYARQQAFIMLQPRR
jgi:predicted aspartyl protease